MEQKLSDTLVKAIDRSNPFMQNLQLASRFNKLVEEGGGGADLEDNKEATIDVSAYTEPVEIEPTAGKDGMKKTTVTLSNIPSGADLDDNVEETIDVSQYTEPVEIDPTTGKDGMKKATITLSNIPSGESNFTAYAWMDFNANYVYFDFSVAPETKAEFMDYSTLYHDGYNAYHVESNSDYFTDSGEFERTSDTEFTYNAQTYTRDSTKDLVAWVDELETNKAQTIDVSQYTEPVEITPTVGKDGMRKATVTLSNIPSGGSATAYAWKVGNNYTYYDFDEAPTDLTEFETHKSIGINSSMDIEVYSLSGQAESYTKIDASSFTVDGVTLVRSASKDFTLWS